MDVEIKFDYDSEDLAKAILNGTAPDNNLAPEGQSISEKQILSSLYVSFSGEITESFLYSIEDFFDKEELCLAVIRAVP